MKKHLIAAFVAALFITGLAGASYIRQIEAYSISTYRLVVGDGPPSTSAIGDLEVQNDLTVTGEAVVTAGVRGTNPAAEAVAAGETIEADACGGVKEVTAAGAVTTDTTNTFTAPAAGNAGCVMQVCNTSANAITLDDNALFFGAGIAGATPGDTVLGADDCCPVGSDGAAWRQLAACAQG